MNKRTRAVMPLVGVIALCVAACVDPQEVSDIKGKVDEIQAQQKDLIGKLDALSKGQKDILAKASAPPAKAAPARPAEDPNKVYEITVGNSATKGPDDATVTIVEWSDFQ